ncbi:MAG: helix-turn-helix domain-containing protein [Oscillospiraceae bacterium]|nr:helix-turn-helix domain-containing protein [Oscillospiraceae bacterium]
MLSLKIAEIRGKRKCKQADIAEFLNISQQAYSAYETGKHQMNYETLSLLADYFDVTTDYLLGRHESIPSFLSDDERTMIEQYRALDEHTRGSIKNSLAFEYSRTPKSGNTKKSAM